MRQLHEWEVAWSKGKRRNGLLSQFSFRRYQLNAPDTKRDPQGLAEVKGAGSSPARGTNFGAHGAVSQ